MSPSSRSSSVQRIALLFVVIAAVFVSGRTLRSQGGGSPCGPNINAIVCENLKPGDPASAWDVSGAGDASIQGFTTDMSVDQGGVVQFKV